MKKKVLKGLFKSKTFWFNAASIVLIIANEFAGKLIPTETATIIISSCNIVLRILTKVPLSDK